jgi:hypothetical protein
MANISGRHSNRKEVDVKEDFERKYWVERLNIASEELKKAVEAVGHNAKDVEAYLRRPRLN